MTDIEFILRLLEQIKPDEITWGEFMYETTDLNYYSMQRLYSHWKIAEMLGIPESLHTFFKQMYQPELEQRYTLNIKTGYWE